MIDNDTLDEMKRRVEQLRAAHRALDNDIIHMIEERPFAQLDITRMKKRKLALKDQITMLESALVPNIIA